jgi:hypothetical protein
MRRRQGADLKKSKSSRREETSGDDAGYMNKLLKVPFWALAIAGIAGAVASKVLDWRIDQIMACLQQQGFPEISCSVVQYVLVVLPIALWSSIVIAPLAMIWWGWDKIKLVLRPPTNHTSNITNASQSESGNKGMSGLPEIKGPGIALAILAMVIAYVVGFGNSVDNPSPTRWALLAALFFAIAAILVVEWMHTRPK